MSAFAVVIHYEETLRVYLYFYLYLLEATRCYTISSVTNSAGALNTRGGKFCDF